MKDINLILHEYSHAVAKAINDAKVTPPEEFKDSDEKSICALMVVVGRESEGPPVATSLNWDRKSSFWRVDPMAQEGVSVEQM
jgi:ABC-type transporter MlaC component